jgi:hypothetical protein
MSADLAGLRDSLMASRVLRIDPGVSEESIFSEVSDLVERGMVSEEDAEEFFRYFDWEPKERSYSNTRGGRCLDMDR